MSVGDRSPRIADGKIRTPARGIELYEETGASVARTST